MGQESMGVNHKPSQESSILNDKDCILHTLQQKRESSRLSDVFLHNTTIKNEQEKTVGYMNAKY